MQNAERMDMRLGRCLVSGILLGLLLGLEPNGISAHGGTELLTEKTGAYELTVFASTYPLQTGTNDISIVVVRLSTAEIVLDAQVTITTESLDRLTEPQSFPASNEESINPFFYVANVKFPTPGRWQLTIQIDGSEDAAAVTFDTEVRSQLFLDRLQGINAIVLVLVGLPLGGIIFFFWMNHRSIEDDFSDNPE